uniref:Uncharacterized protein n=1 Tax=Daucus carota subsp. sativus TaxID=79200 RepID=A0A162B9F6_DAUCS
MDSSPRKRGRPKLCVTKEVLEERRVQKRLRNAARRGPEISNINETSVTESANIEKTTTGSATRTSQAAIPQGSLTGASQAAIPKDATDIRIPEDPLQLT